MHLSRNSADRPSVADQIAADQAKADALPIFVDNGAFDPRQHRLQRLARFLWQIVGRKVIERRDAQQLERLERIRCRYEAFRHAHQQQPLHGEGPLVQPNEYVSEVPVSSHISVPRPGLAVAESNGLRTYRVEMLALEVADRKDGTRAIAVHIGDQSAEMILNPETAAHLAAMLTGETRAV